MGSNSPSSFPRSFTYLMNQTGTPQTPPFCTQSPSFSTQSPSFSTQTPLFGTQTPLFSTQTPLFGDQPPNFSTQTSSTADDADDVDESSPLATREARRRWSIAEDGALVTAWLNTSKDGVTANEQKAQAFWKRVCIYYHGCTAVKDFPPRLWNTCKQRWTKINKEVQWFCGCFDMASRQATSGQSDDDIFQMAYKFYYQDHKTNFVLAHAWRALRNDQKWRSQTTDKGKRQSKRAQPHDSGGVGPREEPEEERPMGVKAAKAAKLRGSKTVKRTSEDREAALKNLEAVAALSEKEFTNKEILADKQVLSNLLGKTEPLNDIEKADLLEMYNSEKRRLDLLQIKHKHVQKAFMASYDRFRSLQRHTLQLREDMAACENLLMEAEQDCLDCGAASREADREMEDCLGCLKETSAKMGEKAQVVKRSLNLGNVFCFHQFACVLSIFVELR
ncbi:unnamed protein product [Microthlaspi erraticum]|uniref:Uncharacterized protein n=1 Tax=Microthlaspi erraticum TaxID=1685480 RepID=A0A6D2I3M1_9BRAS|nr:unnamed protein product [Microthlaspi erraticum]